MQERQAIDTFDLKVGAWTPVNFTPETINGILFPKGLMPTIATHLDKVGIVRSLRAPRSSIHFNKSGRRFREPRRQHWARSRQTSGVSRHWSSNPSASRIRNFRDFFRSMAATPSVPGTLMQSILRLQ
ncbi:MAG: hypothetical protein IPJ07_16435 [Acidobacteria bacterium]|nr:hypothetical protein [Acidobacteriota bacterium]